MDILIFFVILLALVLVHEWGHFAAARLFGIRVDEFAFGFPPRIFSIRRGETDYAFNALPIGGYVRIHGEDPEKLQQDDPDRSRSLVARPKWQQAAVIFSGVAMNVILAWGLFTASLMIGAPTSSEGAPYPVHDPQLTVILVGANTPAQEAGFRERDVLLSVSDGSSTVSPESPDEVVKFVGERGERPMTFSVLRGGEIIRLGATPKFGIVEERAAIGITMDIVGTMRIPFYIAPIEGAKRTWYVLDVTARGIGDFFLHAFIGRADLDSVTGPVGIVQAVGSAADSGFVETLIFAAIISVNLAIINLIPFPALDGGRLLFVGIEAITRRSIPVRVAGFANVLGFALLMLLMLVVTYNDVMKLF
jgi:regulator of sigma E protease